MPKFWFLALLGFLQNILGFPLIAFQSYGLSTSFLKAPLRGWDS